MARTDRRPVKTNEAEHAQLEISKRYRLRAERNQALRRSYNGTNWDLYYQRQDWSHKRPWQSRIFLPNFAAGIRQNIATLKRGLTDSDDWLSVEYVGLGEGLLEEAQIRHLLLFYLDRLFIPGNRPDSTRSLASALGDGLLHAALESLITAKIYPVEIAQTHYRIEQVNEDAGEGVHILYEFAGKQLSSIEERLIRLAIDIIPYESYLPDPSSACLFDIHRVRRHISQLRDNPEYDPDVVDVLYQKAVKREEDQYRQRRAAAPTSVLDDPYIVVVDEFWGDQVNEQTGGLLERNGLWTVSNNLLLRPFTKNPLWHGRRPFVSTWLEGTRTADTQPAVADRVADVVRARNELTSLMLDGAFAEVWGVRQLRTELLEDDSEVQDGVPQGYTGVLRAGVPPNTKFMERVDTGAIPQLSVEMVRDMDASFQVGIGTPSTAQGQLPPRQVKATEIVETMQASGAHFESIAATIEDDWLEPLFELAWQTLLQYVDDLREPEIIQILGPELTLRLQDMTSAERFQVLRDVRFRVRGLRGVAAKQREFTKILTMMEAVSTHPALAELFDRTMEISKLFADMVRGAGLDPEKYRRTETDPLAGGPHLDETLLLAPQGGSPPGERTIAPEQQAIETGFARNRPTPTRG